MPNIGPLELGIILLIVLVLFGARRLPALGRSLGTGMREFKDGVTGKDLGDEAELPAGESAAKPAEAQAELKSRATSVT